MDTTSKSQPTSTDSVDTSTNGSSFVRRQMIKNFTPYISRLDGDSLLLLIHLDLLHLCKADRNTSLNARGSGESRMAAALDGKGTLGQARDQNSTGNLKSMGRLEDTRGVDLSLLSGPVGPSESVILGLVRGENRSVTERKLQRGTLCRSVSQSLSCPSGLGKGKALI